MSKILQLEGQTFGYLTVLEVRNGVMQKLRSWLCECVCGAKIVVSTNKLTSGHTKSCGCLRKDTARNNFTSHGLRNEPEYRVWAAMRQRCENINNPSYRTYGARGIFICKEWDDFAVFLSDMGRRPTQNHTIERRDVNSGYTKENCYWTDDAALQAINQNLKSNNTSGKSGVYWVKDRKRWVAKIFYKGRVTHLGTYEAIEDAIYARKIAERTCYGMEKPDGMG